MKSLHDRTVDEIASAIESVRTPDSAWSVTKSIRWAPMIEFPEEEYLFDIALIEDFDKVKGPFRCRKPANPLVLLVIDVIDEEYEAEFYDKPQLLLAAGVHEYAIYDPSRNRVRPPLHAVRSREGVYRPIRTSASNVFLTSNGFKLDFSSSPVVAESSGKPWREEKFWQMKWAFAQHPTPELESKIREFAENIHRKQEWDEE